MHHKVPALRRHVSPHRLIVGRNHIQRLGGFHFGNRRPFHFDLAGEFGLERQLFPIGTDDDSRQVVSILKHQRIGTRSGCHKRRQSYRQKKTHEIHLFSFRGFLIASGTNSGWCCASSFNSRSSPSKILRACASFSGVAGSSLASSSGAMPVAIASEAPAASWFVSTITATRSSGKTRLSDVKTETSPLWGS